MFIFGLTAPEIEELTQKGAYRPRDYYETDLRLKRVLDELASDRFCPASLACSDGFATSSSIAMTIS